MYNFLAGQLIFTKAQGMRIQINIGLGIGIIFIFYTKPSQDWIIFNLILAKIISTFTVFPSRPTPFCTNLAKKHPMVEDTVNAKLLADSRSHAEKFRL